MSRTYMIKSDYLSDIFTPTTFPGVFEEIVNLLEEWERAGNSFDAIAFRGVSGAALAFPLALKLNKGLLCVRKESSHSDYPVEGMSNVDSYIIVDDFIDTGKTIDEIVSSVKEYLNENAKLVAVVLYAQVAIDRNCSCGYCLPKATAIEPVGCDWVPILRRKHKEE